MEISNLDTYFKNNCILKNASEKNIIKFFDHSAVCIKKFNSGDIIYSPENHEKAVGIVISGKAVAEPAGAKDTALLKPLIVNDMFGIANLYSDEPFPSIIIAKTHVEVLFITASAFCKLIETDDCALKAYLKFLSTRIVFLNKKISTLTAGTTEKRLAIYIAEHECDGVFISSLSMSSLADILNVGRASLYRAIDSLEANGLIVRHDKAIIIPDKNALLNFI